MPHEAGRRHGGSRLEEYEWWTKPGKHSITGTVAAMGREILVIGTLWEHNRSLWYRSFPFHLGLYFLTGFLGLLGIGAVMQAAGAPVGAEAALSSARARTTRQRRRATPG